MVLPPFLAGVEDGGCACLIAFGARGVVGEVSGGGRFRGASLSKTDLLRRINEIEKLDERRLNVPWQLHLLLQDAGAGALFRLENKVSSRGPWYTHALSLTPRDQVSSSSPTVSLNHS